MSLASQVYIDADELRASLVEEKPSNVDSWVGRQKIQGKGYDALCHHVLCLSYHLSTFVSISLTSRFVSAPSADGLGICLGQESRDGSMEYCLQEGDRFVSRLVT